jgi:hypothetical protein
VDLLEQCLGLDRGREPAVRVGVARLEVGGDRFDALARDLRAGRSVEIGDDLPVDLAGEGREVSRTASTS